MTRFLAIARLTFWEGVRMRVVLVFVLILVVIVLRLPFALHGDDTLSGRVQTFLSYSMSALGVLMSLATVFLSCATLSNEIRNKSLHLVTTKPVSRMEILIGKWLGVNLLNLSLVALAGVVIYVCAVFISHQPAINDRDRLKLRDVVWTARWAARPTPPDFEKAAKEYVDRVAAADPSSVTNKAAAVVEKAKEFRENWLMVPPGVGRRFEFSNLRPPRRDDTVYQVRFNLRANPLPRDELVYMRWAILDPDNDNQVPLATTDTRERVSQRHEFLVNAKNVIRDGKASLGVLNMPWYPNYHSMVTFEGDDGLELLYDAGTFEENFVKNLVLILFRLAFLSAVGVFFSTFVSFPVACFCVLSIFLFGMGLPWWLEAIGTNAVVDAAHDPYGPLGPLIRLMLVPILTVALPDFIKYDGVSKLIDGYYISYGLLAKAGAHTVLYGLLLLLLPGWLIFRRREIAEVVL